MPMFYTPKPRQFHYEPRFYDPEKEKWEALKQKYNEKKASSQAENIEKEAQASETDDKNLEYFQSKVRNFDREERRKSSKMTLSDLFRKREMPKFNYQPRFDSNGELIEPTKVDLRNHSTIKIKRRFDIEDSDYLKPVSGGKILLYTFIACLLLYWILVR